jgi:hypothetical protein
VIFGKIDGLGFGIEDHAAILPAFSIWVRPMNLNF